MNSMMSDTDEDIPSPPVSRRSSISSSSSSSSSSTLSSQDDGSMPLPPEGHFPSFKALEKHAQEHAQRHGYAVTSVRWKWRYKNRTTCKKYTMGCHCTTKYRDRMKGR